MIRYTLMLCNKLETKGEHMNIKRKTKIVMLNNITQTSINVKRLHK